MKQNQSTLAWLLLLVIGATQVHSQVVTVLADSYEETNSKSTGTSMVILEQDQWLSYKINIPKAGRYKFIAHGSGSDSASIWVEDYIHNSNGRVYNISGTLPFFKGAEVYGCPLNKGEHDIKFHLNRGKVRLDSLQFVLVQNSQATPRVMEQRMSGDQWNLVWSDEFDNGDYPSEKNWTYNPGNWGWGNNELQYYAVAKSDNATVQNGVLVIKAIRDSSGRWTSARLTTQGKLAFKYGKIEFRAKVPSGRGSWAAGWLLGDEYDDEISWPYCGEIDVLECVGFEIDDQTGDGLNHGSCHTPAYYFKKGNHITGEIALQNMTNDYHTYGIEWYEDRIEAFVDGQHYYTYDKTANELEWPFHRPQNIILNLAIGGGWGGAKGVEESLREQKFIIDYVRVYEKR